MHNFIAFIGCKKKEIQALIEDHLKMLILKHFDPKKADLIFTEEGSVCYSHSYRYVVAYMFECVF